MKLPPLAQLLSQLENRKVKSRDLVEACLTAIADPAGEGTRTFLHVDAEAARAAADTCDARLDGGQRAPLLGLPVSVKDLFDISGQPTPAGSVVLKNAPPATADATIVARLKQAGAIIIGRTNMTEFAYSGLGLNPHFGTPRNPYDRATSRIPGGSSSGAAVSVTDGMATAALGTDTGGSVRIPAALCGLTGFKPTARRVPSHGMLPLAPTLDCIGPIASTVNCCARLDAVLSNETYTPVPQQPLTSMRLGILQGYLVEGLDPTVAEAFDRSITALEAAGATVTALHFPSLARIPASNQFAATEAYAWHRHLLWEHGDQYDPHVSQRIRQGAGVIAADYLDLLCMRHDIIADAETDFADCDAILVPTTPRIAPPIADLEASDEAYFDANGAMLRNTSIFNFLDGCALSIPCHREGEAPVGLMVAHLANTDARILRIGAAIEAALTA